MGEWVKEEKVRDKERMIEGFEKIGDGLVGVLKGENVGKQVVKI
ncbi:hypothetical protein [Bacillus altitudinis]|nr:hypothetical protein [Bacillus altitudinis]